MGDKPRLARWELSMSSALSAAGLWVALIVLLVMALGVNVVRHRARSKVGIGDGGDKGLIRAIRIHGNAFETAAMFLPVYIVLALFGASTWLVHALGAAMFVGRGAHAFGLSQSAGTSPGRAIGMVLTWTSTGVAALAVIAIAVSRGVW
jgi:uncharacterized protein